MKPILLWASALFSLCVALLIAVGLALWQMPMTHQEPVRIEITSGDTLSSKALEWEKQGWLPSATLLKVQARLMQWHRLHTGEFDVPTGMTGPEFLNWLDTAKPVTYRVSLIEGTRVSDALARLAEADKLLQDIEPLTAVEVAKLLKIEGNPEGWLYPDTYVYQAGDRVSTVIRQAHARMQKNLAEAWQNRADDLPYETPYDALVMASIVEKETAVPAERPRIAGVFVRRLQKRMRLETDPTVIYGLGDDYQGNLRKKHLLDSSNPYNTYRNAGLPPTPIALLGRAALDAALNPADGNELFFVAKGDGSHLFSSNLRDHNRAVREYQIERRKKDYRSTPVSQTATSSNPAEAH